MFIDNPESLKRMLMQRRQRGMTLIELIVFIVIVSTALAGTLSVLNLTSAKSADPMIRKQMIALAEALLEEVTLQSFTYCNGNDANVKTAGSATVGAGACATTVQGYGYDVASRGAFSNLTNYCAVTPANSTNCPAMSGAAWGLGDGTATGSITDITGVGTSPLGYSATITLTPAALGGIASAAPSGAANATLLNVVLVTVTVNYFFTPNESITLQSYRTRWAPKII